MLETSFLKFKLLDEGGGAGSRFWEGHTGGVPCHNNGSDTRFGTF